jgi:hypothetical protein
MIQPGDTVIDNRGGSMRYKVLYIHGNTATVESSGGARGAILLADLVSVPAPAASPANHENDPTRCVGCGEAWSATVTCCCSEFAPKDTDLHWNGYCRKCCKRHPAPAASGALVERMAEAMHAYECQGQSWSDCGESSQKMYRDLARAALAVAAEELLADVTDEEWRQVERFTDIRRAFNHIIFSRRERAR